MNGVVRTTGSTMVPFPNGITYTADVAAGSATLKNLSSTDNLAVGMAIVKDAASAIPAGTTIVQIVPEAGEIVLSQKATTGSSGDALTFGNAAGSHASTFNFNDIPKGTQTSHADQPQSSGPDKTVSKNFSDLPNAATATTTTPGAAGQSTHSHTDTTPDPLVQHTTIKGYTFRHPRLENDAQFQRQQSALLDEQFKQFMLSQNLPFLPTVFNNDLATIDLDVKRLQVSYANTILVSPIGGLITGLFKHPGDPVKPGEAVMRVEQDDVILIVGTIKCRAALHIGAAVDIQTILFDTAVPGPVGGPPPGPGGQAGGADRQDRRLPRARHRGRAVGRGHPVQ